MEICGIFCEFNPFHNGHKYLIEQAKKLSGCEKIICIMSGSFTQRGDMCIMDKYVRACHAVLCGADAVIELPVSFSVAPAEIFATGAFKILNSLPDVKYLAFGCENELSDFLAAANILTDESPCFKHVLNENLSKGESYIKSYNAAYVACGGNADMLSLPNNLLGMEYAKAILRAKSTIKPLPIGRIGSSHKDEKLNDDFSSASSIRNNISNPLIRFNIPECVYNDLDANLVNPDFFNSFLQLELIKSDPEQLKHIYGCTEGLENRILKLSGLSFENLLAEAAGKRYSVSRIKRILTANALGLYKYDCEAYLKSELYIKPLAVKKEGADETLSLLGSGRFPLITKKRDLEKLSPSAKECFARDEKTYNIWKCLAKLLTKIKLA